MLKNFVSLCCKASGTYYHYYPAIGSLNFSFFFYQILQTAAYGIM